MARIRALRSFYGAEGMVHCGETVETTDRRAELHVEEGRAEYLEEEQHPDYTTTEQTPEYSTTEQAPARDWEGNGSWKTLYEGGEAIAKVQTTKEEAEQWANGDLSTDEIQS